MDIWHGGAEWVRSYVTESDDGCGIANQIHCVSHMGMGANKNKPCMFMKCNTMTITLHNLKSWVLSACSNDNSHRGALFEALQASARRLGGNKSTRLIESKISRPEHGLDLRGDTCIHLSCHSILIPFIFLAGVWLTQDSTRETGRRYANVCLIPFPNHIFLF